MREHLHNLSLGITKGEQTTGNEPIVLRTVNTLTTIGRRRVGFTCRCFRVHSLVDHLALFTDSTKEVVREWFFLYGFSVDKRLRSRPAKISEGVNAIHTDLFDFCLTRGIGLVVKGGWHAKHAGQVRSIVRPIGSKLL